ncbi:DUF432 domain-containing protein [Methanoculleus sp. FWC-SCC1]|uniref:DUF432 domain-containing protein n=1 Tax=Methanoculleus frigidifontis TaxID=2584085 RepID=A0ABT8M877_9EURY|nr:DUF432 domain-containing protein [Methanoculleus sp. FWC-SCC1]MDN7024130.1 DUF432 domain-containing protein [Methanoculleus sp. FWC-SCC1]
MFGRYDYSFHFTYDGIDVGIDQQDGLLVYRRDCGGQQYERILASETGGVVVNPVEPLNLPKEVTNFLQIEFDPIVIEPLSTTRVYLTFPVEIGIFLEARRDMEVLDIFGLNHQKYTLYGPPNGGVIARWHRSRVSAAMPEVEPLREGVLELRLRNMHREWVEVSRAVFESYDMKIYYNDFVGMTAEMRILNKNLAETDFIDAPLTPGMKKSVELYTAREIPVIKKGYLMAWGLA